MPYKTAPPQPKDMDGYPAGSVTLTLEAESGSGEKVTSYRGFYSDYTFDAQGKFHHIGIWE